MHMKIEGKKLAHNLDVHKHLVDEIRIKFKKIGVSITSISADHISMLTTFLHNTACQEYDISAGDLEIGIDIKKLRDFLKLGKPSDIFTFDYDIENMKLIVKLGNIVRTMGLVDTEGLPDPKPITLLMKNKAIIDTKTFYNSLKGVMPGKSSVKRKRFRDINEINLTISKDDLKDTIILENQDNENENENKKSVIERDFVQDVIAPISITNIYDVDVLSIQIGEYKKFLDQIVIGLVEKDQPLYIIGKNEDMELEYWLAPRVHGDDEIPRQHSIADKDLAPEPEVKEPIAEPELKTPEPMDPIEPLELEVQTHTEPEVKPEFEIKKAVKEPDLPEKPPLEEQISAEKPGVTTEKPRPKAQKRPQKPTEPIVAAQKTKTETRDLYKDIGWLASPKNDFYLVGEIIAVTKTGYIILFRGSKKIKDPVEMDRDLVEVYRRE